MRTPGVPTSYEISDALIHAAKQAESLIERLLEENQRMKQALVNYMPDGTPVEDVLEELAELKQDYAKVRRLLDSIKRVALGANAVSAYNDLKTICHLIIGIRT